MTSDAEPVLRIPDVREIVLLGVCYAFRKRWPVTAKNIAEGYYDFLDLKIGHGLKYSTIYNAILSMNDEGLFTSKREHVDRRVLCYELTPRGLQIMKLGRQFYSKVAQDIVVLDDAEDPDAK